MTPQACLLQDAYERLERVEYLIRLNLLATARMDIVVARNRLKDLAPCFGVELKPAKTIGSPIEGHDHPAGCPGDASRSEPTKIVSPPTAASLPETRRTVTGFEPRRGSCFDTPAPNGATTKER